MAKKKTQKTNEMAKIKVERVYEEQIEPPFQYLKPKPIEHIPNAHLAHQELKEVESNMTLSQDEIVLQPIFTPIEVETNQEVETVLNLLPVEIETNEVLTPMSELIKFINYNAKEHLIEINFLMRLIAKAHELKDLEKEVLNEFIKDAYNIGYVDGTTKEQASLPFLFNEKFNPEK
jgi:hypothetical protein